MAAIGQLMLTGCMQSGVRARKNSTMSPVTHMKSTTLSISLMPP